MYVPAGLDIVHRAKAPRGIVELEQDGALPALIRAAAAMVAVAIAVPSDTGYPFRCWFSTS